MTILQESRNGFHIHEIREPYVNGLVGFTNMGGTLSIRRSEFQDVGLSIGTTLSEFPVNTNLLVVRADNPLSNLGYYPSENLRRQIDESQTIAILVGGQPGVSCPDYCFPNLSKRMERYLGRAPTNSLEDQGYFFQIPMMEHYVNFRDIMGIFYDNSEYSKDTSFSDFPAWRMAVARRSYNNPLDCVTLDLIARSDFQQAVSNRDRNRIRQITSIQCPEVVFSGVK